MKLLLLLVGFAGGAAGTASWLLSLPESPSEPVIPASAQTLQERVDVVRARAAQAIAEGQRAGAETEKRLKAELDSYRRGASS